MFNVTTAVAQMKVDHLTPIKGMAAAEFYDIKGLTNINFDVDPSGLRTNSKKRIDELYQSLGVTFTHENEDPKKQKGVVVFRYNCGGISGGMCVANGSPAYNGVMRITFHTLGKPKEKATITQFGVYLSAVKPNGTSIEAYNVNGVLLGSVTVEEVKQFRKNRSGYCFLGAKSDSPMHYLRIIPNPDIDPDYAIDDLGFDIPKKSD